MILPLKMNSLAILAKCCISALSCGVDIFAVLCASGSSMIEIKRKSIFLEYLFSDWL
ncbi:hypothetical protein SAMN02982985_02424 [Rugamonas rubra]|uniref:Uncharacterized protein n=1 Tax=Rugamonas rubra TaxID=758825 RepID=A0A1I4MIT9_9BURK|nr:hypothetical protein SAMN02982985_02424 [Rugamonas rubra]